MRDSDPRPSGCKAHVIISTACYELSLSRKSYTVSHYRLRPANRDFVRIKCEVMSAAPRAPQSLFGWRFCLPSGSQEHAITLARLQSESIGGVIGQTNCASQKSTEQGILSKDSMKKVELPSATQGCKSNVRCRGGDVISCSQRAISPFIQRKKHCPLFLASPLHDPSESHRATGERRNGKLKENRL